MGYAHYFKQIKPVPADQWDEVLEAKDKIVKFKEGLIDIEDDSLNGDLNINGVGEDSHENLYIDPDHNKIGEFQFCKTANKPYDVVVVAILCVINDICHGCFKITSDGDRDDWKAGRELASAALGDFYDIPVTVLGDSYHDLLNHIQYSPRCQGNPSEVPERRGIHLR